MVYLFNYLDYYKNNIIAFIFIYLLSFSIYLFIFNLAGTPYISNNNFKISAKQVRLVHLKSEIVKASAYNSLKSQTDSDPWTTASGKRCRWGTVAANFLPFGTKLKIEGFGDTVFVVEDRMAKRFSRTIDIWFPHYNSAIKFGRRDIRYWIVAEK